jgi:hypothetical protein
VCYHLTYLMLAYFFSLLFLELQNLIMYSALKFYFNANGWWPFPNKCPHPIGLSSHTLFLLIFLTFVVKARKYSSRIYFLANGWLFCWKNRKTDVMPSSNKCRNSCFYVFWLSIKPCLMSPWGWFIYVTGVPTLIATSNKYYVVALTLNWNKAESLAIHFYDIFNF